MNSSETKSALANNLALPSVGGTTCFITNDEHNIYHSSPTQNKQIQTTITTTSSSSSSNTISSSSNPSPLVLPTITTQSSPNSSRSNSTPTTTTSPTTRMLDLPPQEEEALALEKYRMKSSSTKKNINNNECDEGDDENDDDDAQQEATTREEHSQPIITSTRGKGCLSSSKSTSFIQASFSPSLLLAQMQSSSNSSASSRRHSHHTTENPNSTFQRSPLDNGIHTDAMTRRSKSMATNSLTYEVDDIFKHHRYSNSSSGGISSSSGGSSSDDNQTTYPLLSPPSPSPSVRSGRSFSIVSSDCDSDILPAMLSRRLSQYLPSVFTNWKQVIDLQTKFMIMFVFLDYASLVLTTYFKQGLFNSIIMSILCLLGFISVKWSFLRDLPSYVNDLYRDSKTYSSKPPPQQQGTPSTTNLIPETPTSDNYENYDTNINNNNNLLTSPSSSPINNNNDSWSHKLTSIATHYSTSQLVFFNLMLFTLRFLMSDSKMQLTPMSLFSIASIAACKYRDSVLHSKKKRNGPSESSLVLFDTCGEDDIETVVWSQFPFYYIAFHYFCYMLYQLMNADSNMGVENIVMIVVDNYPSISMVMIFGFFAVFASIYISVEYRKLTNIASKLKEAVQIKNNFLSHVSHELRTPLLSSLGSIELIKETPLTSEQYDHMEIIHASNSILLTLIEDILVFIDLDHKKPKTIPETIYNTDSTSHHHHLHIGSPTTTSTATNTTTTTNTFDNIESSSKTSSPRVVQNRDNVLQSFSLSRSLRTVLSLLEKYADKFKVNIEFKIDECLEKLVVKTNETRLQQCVINILTNAIKASVPDTTVNLQCSVHNKSTTTTTTNQQLQPGSTREIDDPTTTKIWIDISVTDYGIGIPIEKQKAIFEPFQQLHNLNESVSPGTGLGLCTTKRIIEQMGGVISLMSVPKYETTFTLTLPMEIDRTSQIRESKSSKSNQQRQDSNIPTKTINSTTDSGGHKTFKLSSLHNAIERQIQIQENYLEQFEKTQKKMEPYIKTQPVNTLEETPPPAAASSGSGGVDASSKNSKIIVAEDNAINRQVLLKLLSNLGQVADSVVDGEELIRAFDINKHKLVITDMHMPNMNGLEASTILKKKYGDEIKIVMLTADALTDFSTEQYMKIVDMVICKPCSKQKLKETIEAFL